MDWIKTLLLGAAVVLFAGALVCALRELVLYHAGDG